jgi:hypothetical protein
LVLDARSPGGASLGTGCSRGRRAASSISDLIIDIVRARPSGCGDKAVERQRLLHLVDGRIGEAALDFHDFAGQGMDVGQLLEEAVVDMP